MFGNQDHKLDFNDFKNFMNCLFNHKKTMVILGTNDLKKLLKLFYHKENMVIKGPNELKSL